ncbi:MAG: LON peptidase substrate-binding domain-containing protein [Fimbriimonadales bacterium]|nr:LON peptidase substrate-binding domain-containing protein [Fimbriimonadales bacterium]MDW8052423.1 LON peptidase substrate-binding domain-containing protein [Armatimonadota bacterium]
MVRESTWIIPLFPLDTVLFPYTALPLHIFEPRYREMVMYCLENDSPFGVVLVREGSQAGDPDAELHEVGTLARIGRLRRLPDGRFFLLALGEERFQIVRLIRGEAPFLKAQVRLWRDAEPLSQEEERKLAEEVATEFRTFLRKVLDISGLRVEDIELPHDPTALSFAIAGALQLDVHARQYLLELQNTTERLRIVQQVMRGLMASLAVEIVPFDPNRWREYIHRN